MTSQRSHEAEEVSPDTVERLAAAALPWIHDAGNPYFGWLFGGDPEARAVLARWVQRPDSEVALARVRPFPNAAEPLGGYIALTAAELGTARKADAIALLAEATREQRRERLGKLREADGLFTEPGEDELYLSKMGVVADQRGKGHGRRILEAFVAEAAATGFSRIRLDVCTSNQAAVGLYRSTGFVPVEGTYRSRAGFTYHAMWRSLEH